MDKHRPIVEAASDVFYNTGVNNILNISSYKFVALPDAEELRPLLLDRCLSRGLKGTILLAEEGINLFLAGYAEAVRGFVAELHTDPRFSDIAPKESWSETVPFKKMLVKVKGEIIRMNHPTIRPAEGRAPAVTPATAKRWLDQGFDDNGRPVVVLDTRNDYEVDEGTFKGAIDWRLTKFTEFPDALRAHKEELQDKTIISFCTGGIRCEKAAIFMQQNGLPHTYQLEGGILKYFEETDGSHYDGGCFVFDERVSVGHGLVPGPHELCRACREPLPAGAKQSPLFELGVSCPTCHAHTSEDKKTKARERQRQWALQQWRAPLTLD